MLHNTNATLRGDHCVVWFPGLYATNDSSKAEIVKKYCAENNLSFISFNYPHHGDNENFKEFTLTEAVDDVYKELIKFDTPYSFVTSSFGCWVAMLVAKKFIAEGRGHQIQGLLAISPWIDDVRNRPSYQRLAVRLFGFYKSKNMAKGKPIYWKFAKDAMAEHNHVWDTGLIEKLEFPIRVIHGSNDTVAKPWITKKLEKARNSNITTLSIGHGFDELIREKSISYLDELTANRIS